MDFLHLYPLAHKKQDSRIIRTCRIERISEGKTEAVEELWYEFDTFDAVPDENDCESYLIAMLMDAMQENRDIVIHGTVSHELLSNLIEFRDAWSAWLPQKYFRINFSADYIMDKTEISQGAVCAFSGGVDATFSVWRNSQNMNSYRSQEIKLAAMVHGFDIPLNDNQSYENAFNQAESTLISVNIPLFSLKTNYRKIARAGWEHAFAAALIAALSNFKNMAGTCIVGSGEPYDSLVIPWGSNPITDPLLTSGSFRVILDGAAFSRVQKIKILNEWQDGRDNLRVCWEGEDKDRNCGNCEKCLRTMMGFKASQLKIPASFQEKKIPLKKIFGFRLKKEVLFMKWSQILHLAQKNKIKKAWVTVLKMVIWRESIINFFRRFFEILKYWMRPKK